MEKRKVWLAVFSLFFLILLLLLSYKIVLSLTELTPDQQATINFLNHNRELELNYTSAEISHLEDVKKVMGSADYLFYLALFICIVILTCYRRDKEFLRKLFFYGGTVTVSILFLLLLLILSEFNSAFTAFHQIVFPQGNWLFPADSFLIQNFPIEFFIGISRKIFLFALILGGLTLLGSLTCPRPVCPSRQSTRPYLPKKK
jgi:integral membrane protein (TIGR01906 family)